MAVHIRITHRFALLAVLALILVGGSLALALVQIRTAMLEQKRLEIRHSVEAAATIVQGFVARARSGARSHSDARALEGQAIRQARLDGG